MLALPLTTLSLGFIPSLFLLVSVWALMLTTALITLKVTLSFPEGSTFHTMARAVLGRGGWWLTTLSVMGLFYALLAAYTAGATDFLRLYIDVPEEFIAVAFLIFFGAIISWKTSAVDFSNRILFAGLIVIFVLIVFVIAPHIQMDHILKVPQKIPTQFWVAIPIFVTSFGFHGSIPSLVRYIGKKPAQLKFVFIVGSALPLLVYIIWQALTLGILPMDSAESLPSVEQVIINLGDAIKTPWISHSLDLFAQLAIVTSFLGVGMGLRSFFRDMLKNTKRHSHLLITLVTFAPPMLIVLIAPSIFVQALGFAAIALLNLAIFIPLTIAFKLDGTQLKLSPLQRVGLKICYGLGMIIMAIEVLHIFGAF